MRLLMMMMVAVAACGPAEAQRVFRASSIDVEQNQRLDSLEAEVSAIRSTVAQQSSAPREPKTPPARLPMTEAPPPEVEDDRVAVHYGDMKNVDGVDYSLQEVEGAPRWMPIETTAPTAVVTTPQVNVAVGATTNRYSTAEIQDQIRRLRPSGSTAIQYADVQPRSWAKSHLVGEHGYTSAQVGGLSANEAVILHDLRHGGKVSPIRSGQATVARSTTVTVTPRAVAPAVNNYAPIYQPAYQASGGCPNGQCPTQRSTSRTVTRQRTGLFGWR